MINTMSTTLGHLEGFRQRKDAFFKTHEQSPLTPEQRERFQALSYLPPDDALSLILELDKSGEGVGEEITVGTMSGEPKQYIRVGRIHFEVDGQPVTLSVFQDKVTGKFFLPFRDSTAGEETYAVGRYLDPRPLPDGRLSIDFNFAHNPYCAYSDGWSCPIPPAENVTAAPIRAGERLR